MYVKVKRDLKKPVSLLKECHIEEGFVYGDYTSSLPEKSRCVATTISPSLMCSSGPTISRSPPKMLSPIIELPSTGSRKDLFGKSCSSLTIALMIVRLGPAAIATGFVIDRPFQF